MKRDPDSFDMTGHEFANYLAVHCQNAKCPACGTLDPPIIAADSADGVVHLSTAPIAQPSGYGAKGYCTAICKHCAYVWHFDASMVLDWVLDQRKKAPDNESS